MTAHIALLRGINVGGRTSLAMRDLVAMLGELGLTQGRSLLQSGNLIFGSEGRSPEQLEALLEREIAARFDRRPDVLVRGAAAWLDVVDRNPLGPEAERDPAHLIVMALKTAPTPAGLAALAAATLGEAEYFRAEGPHLYIAYPEGIGRSRLTIPRIENAIGVRGTGRNWNTALKLAAALRGAPAPT